VALLSPLCAAVGLRKKRRSMAASSPSGRFCTRILDAAERLFAERGFRGTSVRAITDLAGANLAAVGYHFGSKAELLAAVARRVIEPVNAAQCAGLDRLLARTPDPSAAELVAAFAGPLFDEMPAGDEGGARTSRLIVTIIADPAQEARSWTGPAEDTVRDRHLAAFGRALPGLSPRSCCSGCGGSSPWWLPTASRSTTSPPRAACPR
jgi:AcrR family transcriptional regulator